MLFLLKLFVFFFALGIVFQTLGCGKDAMKALRMKIRKWLFKDED